MGYHGGRGKVKEQYRKSMRMRVWVVMEAVEKFRSPRGCEI